MQSMLGANRQKKNRKFVNRNRKYAVRWYLAVVHGTLVREQLRVTKRSK